jgi:uncharacterized membrane protein
MHSASEVVAMSLLPIHIVAGALAMLLGAVALVAAKGGRLHRQSGLLFVLAMLTMGISGSILAMRQSLTNVNVLGGFVSAYFVVTALTTVRPASAWTRGLNAAALVVASALVLVEVSLGFMALASPTTIPGCEWCHTLDGVPFFMMFFMAAVTAAAAGGDIRLLRSGPLPARARLARHLWRMCFGLFIAAGSFFSIPARVAKILPDPFTTPAMRMLPIAAVFLAMFFWLARVRGRRLPARHG